MSYPDKIYVRHHPWAISGLNISNAHDEAAIAYVRDDLYDGEQLRNEIKQQLLDDLKPPSQVWFDNWIASEELQCFAKNVIENYLINLKRR